MKNLLKLEELAQFAFCMIALVMLNPQWWCYGLLLIGPDISMLGYLINTKTGAFAYNLFHHKGIALLFMMFALVQRFGGWHADAMSDQGTWAALTGLVLYGHASMDRIFGYGLKFGDSFQHTHLGWIGKLKGQEQGQ